MAINTSNCCYCNGLGYVLYFLSYDKHDWRACTACAGEGILRVNNPITKLPPLITSGATPFLLAKD